jgi:NTE family protein
MDILESERFVFSGGGLRGIAYLGALLALKDRTGREVHEYPALKEVVGCSIGAFVALLVAMECTVVEMQTIMQTLDLSKVFEVSYESIITTFAINDATALTKMVVDALAMKNVPTNCTFADFSRRFKMKVSVGITDLTNAKFVLASHETTPTMPVLTAVVASMSLPPMFPPQKWGGMMLSDGGLMNSFPIDMFPVERTLGFKLAWYVDAASPMENVLTYYTRVLQCLQLPLDAAHERYKIIHIDVGNISAFRTEGISESSARLLLNGYRQTNLQFDRETQVHPDPCKYIRNG